MSATPISGTDGNVTLPTGVAGKIKSWSGDLTLKVDETTGFSDGGYEAHAPVKLGLRGSAAGYAISESAPISTSALGTSTVDFTKFQGPLTLTAASGKTYGGSNSTAIISNIRMSRPCDGVMDLSFDFQFSGAFAGAWS